MSQLLKEISDSFKVAKITDVRTGDTVKIFQKIIEGNKERVQVFEGLVIGSKRAQSNTYTITVRRIASGVGVEKTFQLHSPTIEKVEVVKRSHVRRANLVYMRGRSGKSARLTSLQFDKEAVNYVPSVEDKAAVPEELIEKAETLAEAETAVAVVEEPDEAVAEEVAAAPSETVTPQDEPTETV